MCSGAMLQAAGVQVEGVQAPVLPGASPGWRSLCGFFSDFLLPRWTLDDLCPLCPTPWLPILKLMRPTNKNLVPWFLRKTEATVFSYCFMGSLHFYSVTTGKHQVGEGKRVELFFFAETSLQSLPLSLTVKEEIKSFS